LHALAALSVLASPTHLEALPDLEPVVREIRRVAPALGWALVDEHPRRRARTPCPATQEQVDSVTEVATATIHNATRAHSRVPHQHSRLQCRPIEVPQDPHTHDPVLTLEDRVRIIHPRLLSMLDHVAQHFTGHRVELISGYRPSNNPQSGSRHAHARALDYRLADVSREALRDFAYTLPLAGVGYYPNSVFIHMDVRDSGEGSARWTDYSSQGETPRYGHWPPREQDVARETEFLVNQAERALSATRTNDDDSRDADLRELSNAASGENEAEHSPVNAEQASTSSTSTDQNDDQSSHTP
jgi:hypothetical protein